MEDHTDTVKVLIFRADIKTYYAAPTPQNILTQVPSTCPPKVCNTASSRHLAQVHNAI